MRGQSKSLGFVQCNRSSQRTCIKCKADIGWLEVKAAVPLIAALAISLSGCGGGEVAKAVKEGLPEAENVARGTSKDIHVQDPDTGEDESLHYVMEGGKWVFEKCHQIESAGAPRTCEKPDGAPEDLGG